MVKKLSDLRFIIGLFFTTMGLILLGTVLVGVNDLVQGVHLNLISGTTMAVFGVFMLAISFIRYS